MKRFYADVTIGEANNILLDGRPLKTPRRAALAVPSLALAEAIADEWRTQGEKVDPRTMPLTGLANAAIDVVGTDRGAFLATLNAYAETDMLTYRADQPADLVARQRQFWDPLLGWATKRYDAHFNVTSGILHTPQPDPTIIRLRAALSIHDDFQLAALAPIVSISGSLVIALMLAEDAIDCATAFNAAHLDELYQVEHWGEDSLASGLRTARRADFFAAVSFLALLRG